MAQKTEETGLVAQGSQAPAALMISALEKNMKPILVNVVTRLKKDLSIILYRHLDIIMADKTHFERMVDELKEEFENSKGNKKKLNELFQRFYKFLLLQFFYL